MSKNATLDTIGNSRLPRATKAAYLKKRAAKALTKAVMYRMFGLDSQLNGDYRQAYMCNEYLFHRGNVITSNYCRKKCCTVCSRIKGAQQLSKYGRLMLEMDDLYLVTLTDKNVYKGQLADNVDGMYNALKRIKKNIHKNYKELKINGYRSFECTYGKNGFNPHFHFIVKGKESAELLLRLWLKQMPNADIAGQDIKPVTKTKKSLLELFKYIAKPITRGYYSASAYDEIMIAVKYHRVSEPLGQIRGAGSMEKDDGELSLDELESQKIDFKGHRYDVWTYVQDLYDYVSTDGELLLDEPIDSKTLNAINVVKRKAESEAIKKGKSCSEIFKERRKQKPQVVF